MKSSTLLAALFLFGVWGPVAAFILVLASDALATPLLGLTFLGTEIAMLLVWVILNQYELLRRP